MQRIQWIGRRHIDVQRHVAPRQVLPIQIVAGAFGRGRPRRALRLSPDHAVFAHGVLVPVRYLVNGTTIVQLSSAAITKVVYYHIELPRHGVVLAERLPVETYLDTGDRHGFSNGAGHVTLFPDFSTRVWEAEGCAPLCILGPTVDAIHARLDRIATRLRARAAAAAPRERRRERPSRLAA